MPGVRLCVATAVAQHVGVNQEVEAGTLADALYQSIDGMWREWITTLGGENMLLILALQLP